MFDAPFPEITDKITHAMPQLPPIFEQPPAVEKTNAIAAGIASVQGEVAKFDQIAAGLAAIEAAHPKNVIVAAIDTPPGMQAAQHAWRAYRNPRLEVERARKAAKAPVLALGKAIDTFAGGLEDRLREGEDHYKAQIDAEDARRAAIRAEQERIEREAAENHASRLAAISMYALRCQEPGMTADRISNGIAMLQSADMSDPFTPRAVELSDAQCRTLESMRILHAQAVAREAHAARQEAIRQENERVAAELAVERQRIAEEAAAIRRQAAELEAQRAESARLAEDAIVASIHANARRIEGDASGYVQKAISHFESAACDWQDDNRPRVHEAINEGRRYLAERLAAAMDTERQESQQVLKAEPPPADATDRDTPATASPSVGTMGAGQAADAAPAADILAREAQIHTAGVQAMQAEAQLISQTAPLPPAEPDAPAVDEPADVTMGALANALGFRLTEEFVRDTLGVTPAKRDGRAVQFTRTQRRQILTALARHVQSLI